MREGEGVFNLMPHEDDPSRSDIETYALKYNANQFFNLVDNILPDCREKSLFKTHLEEAVMWAVKGIHNG